MTLHDFIQQRRLARFVWGQADCCLLAADWVQSQTGTDFAAAFRGRYRTALGAKRVLAKAGLKDIEDAVTQALGKPVGRLQLHRGDLALIEQFRGPALGIASGDRVWVPGEYELVTVPLAQALKGWRLPCRQS
ncbi:hypothetical protein PVT67_11625 [Gallaecimonas kandeliae]|uniref:DUF6950 family protein n=1 Tax=Gallaecimonas kandeliae TaxID=3029055 RepID=UPI0026479614|nr:hypothetical protein [Gallaecimonas kandeliae]WKE64329.1 hypothetical protein PVT67_11625 [Gallaecimonas kandeliae]